jgi:hypothetical protein
LRGAADIASVLALLAGQLFMMRVVREDPEPQILLPVILDRNRVTLAMARREIKNFCASFAA